MKVTEMVYKLDIEKCSVAKVLAEAAGSNVESVIPLVLFYVSIKLGELPVSQTLISTGAEALKAHGDMPVRVVVVKTLAERNQEVIDEAGWGPETGMKAGVSYKAEPKGKPKPKATKKGK